MNKRWALAALCVGILLSLLMTARVRYTGSDPAPALVVSHSLIHGDGPYIDDYVKTNNLTNDYRVHPVGERFLYYFPLGSSIAAVPVVAVAARLGIDVLNPGDNGRLQVWLAWVSLLIIYGVLVRILMPSYQDAAFAISLVLVLGGPLLSTGGTAYWSHVPAALFGSIALLLIASPSAAVSGALAAGVLLGFGSICRPIMATLVASTVLLGPWLWGWRKTMALMGGAALVVSAFAVANVQWYGSILPDYFNPRLRERGSAFLGLLGVLFSPSRGLFVFSPYLVSIAAIAAWQLIKRRASPIQYVAMFWIVLHIGIVSQLAQWWGGHCYGPRLLTETTPAWAIVIAQSRHQIRQLWSSRIARAALVALVGWSLWLNAGVGLYNRWASWWSEAPNVDEHAERLWSVRFAQWRETPERRQERLAEHFQSRLKERGLEPRAIDEQVWCGSDDIVALGWSSIHDSSRTANTHSPEIWVQYAAASQPCVLKVRGRGLVETSTTVRVDDQDMGVGRKSAEPEWVEWRLPRSVLMEESLTVLSFHIPGARGDPSQISVVAFRFEACATEEATSRTVLDR